MSSGTRHLRSGYWIVAVGLLIFAAVSLAPRIASAIPGVESPVTWVDATLLAYLFVMVPALWIGAAMVAVEKGYHAFLGLFFGLVATLLLPWGVLCLVGAAFLVALALLPEWDARPIESPFFVAGLWVALGYFLVGWVALFAADVAYIDFATVGEVLEQREIQAALWLSIWTSLLSVVIGLAFAVPMGYALSRYRFRGHVLVDSMVDLPIILPPLIVGMSLLVFFRTEAGQFLENLGLTFVYQKSGIVLCQFLASASFGIRAVKLTFDGVDPRLERVAMTLGCTRAGAFFRVALPLARRGVITGGILIWTRAFGIFGPLMVFVGAVRMRTEVLPTAMYLEQSVGRIEVALALFVVMLILATVALVGVRMVGLAAR
ncbi:MAG: ABC transporter permease [Planctomycetota bacterium]|jgi:molybdate transport system permease protein